MFKELTHLERKKNASVPISRATVKWFLCIIYNSSDHESCSGFSHRYTIMNCTSDDIDDFLPVD
jgi:hypothetical protein